MRLSLGQGAILHLGLGARDPYRLYVRLFNSYLGQQGVRTLNLSPIITILIIHRLCYAGHRSLTTTVIHQLLLHMNLEVRRLTLLQAHLLSLSITAPIRQTLPIRSENIGKLLFLIRYLLMVQQLHLLLLYNRLLQIERLISRRQQVRRVGFGHIHRDRMAHGHHIRNFLLTTSSLQCLARRGPSRRGNQTRCSRLLLLNLRIQLSFLLR